MPSLSGDVDTSAEREAKDGTLTGLTGRTLKLGGDWQNPGGKWRVGIKAAYELFPGSLVSRLKRERKKEWDKQQRERMAGLQAKLADFDEAKPVRIDRFIKKRAELGQAGSGRQDQIIPWPSGGAISVCRRIVETTD